MKSIITKHKKNSINWIFSASFLLGIISLQMSYGQNTCATASTLTAGIRTVTAIDGTNITTTCSNPALAEWYIYTPTQNYSVTITSDLVQNICNDTDFEVYTGSCAALTCFTGDDDSGIIQCNAGNTNSYLSKKTFDVTAGTTYYIAWTNRWSALGFDFQLIENPILPNPCLSSTPITAGITTVNAIDQTNINTTCSTTSLAKWYSYTPTQNYQVTVTSDLIENICKDTNFSVYTGSCSALVCYTSDDDLGVIACNSGNTNSSLSTKTFTVNGGTTYYIVWDNKWSASGFNFQLIEAIIPPPPVAYTSTVISTVNSNYNLCVVDMNNDFKDDIVGVSAGNLKVHSQGAGGVFTISDFPITGTSKMPSWSIAAGDYNRDGFNDILLGSGNGVTFWRSNTIASLAYDNITPGDNTFCQRTNFIDINNDGHLDAFSCHDIAPNVYFLNNGTGNLTYYQSGVSPGAYLLGITPSGGNYASLWTDYDNDGDSDMFVSKCSGPPCELHRNDGNGVFTDVSALAQINVTPIQSWSSAISDFDNDGDMDIIIGSNGATPHKFFRNNLDTSNSTEEAFTDITAGSGWDTNTSINRDYIAYDFDNNGFVDVLGSGNKIMFNQGNNVFAATNYAAISVGGVGDLNNDGFLDILNGNTVRYAVPNANNWLKINLQGIQSNRNGIGTRIEIYGAWGKQIREVRSGEGFSFMSTLNTHFGIGLATAISQVIVKWPSGIIDTINNPSINQSLSVVEGATLSVNEFENSVFRIYPNPAKDIVSIQLKSNITIETVEVYDLTAKLVLTSKIENDSINLEKLSSGTYLLLLTDQNGKNYSQKIIKE